MQFQPPPRPWSVLGSVLAAAGVVLAVASCSHITPLGPDPAATTLPPPRHLGSPIILQVMRSQPPTAAGRCPAGWAMVPMPGGAPTPCFRPIGKPVRLTTAGISAVSPLPSGPPGHPQNPAPYGFTVAVPAAHVAAVTAIIRHAFDSRGAVGISVAGKTWDAAQVLGRPFPGQQFQIALPTRNQALQLYRMLVPPG